MAPRPINPEDVFPPYANYAHAVEVAAGVANTPERIVPDLGALRNDEGDADHLICVCPRSPAGRRAIS